jgi:hypothetical protein
MTRGMLRTLAVAAVVVPLSGMVVYSQAAPRSAPRYRDFVLGSTVAEVSAVAGTPSTAVKVLHERPALMQSLEWRPRHAYSSPAGTADPVEQVMFSFYNDQLFTVTVDYDTRRTAALTEADLIEAISAAYGSLAQLVALPRKTSSAGSAGDPYAAVPIARWGDATYSITLLRAIYPMSFRMVMEFTSLARLATSAEAEAARLDALQAPERELARQKRDAADEAAAQDLARRVNKPAFKP